MASGEKIRIGKHSRQRVTKLPALARQWRTSPNAFDHRQPAFSRQGHNPRTCCLRCKAPARSALAPTTWGPVWTRPCGATQSRRRPLAAMPTKLVSPSIAVRLATALRRACASSLDSWPASEWSQQKTSFRSPKIAETRTHDCEFSEAASLLLWPQLPPQGSTPRQQRHMTKR